MTNSQGMCKFASALTAEEAADLAAAMLAALPRGVAEALADPIVQALMAADRVDPRELAALMWLMAARLSDKTPSTGRGFSW